MSAGGGEEYDQNMLDEIQEILWYGKRDGSISRVQPGKHGDLAFGFPAPM